MMKVTYREEAGTPEDCAFDVFTDKGRDHKAILEAVEVYHMWATVYHWLRHLE